MSLKAIKNKVFHVSRDENSTPEEIAEAKQTFT